jgi:GNAT superfamily N-acetyltransferase
MTRTLQDLPSAAAPRRALDARHIRDDDRAALGALLFLAYLGGPDQEENDPDEGLAEINRTMDGAYGPFVASASFVVVDAETIVAASLVTTYESLPLLAHLIVHPSAQREGIGSWIATRSLVALASHNEPLARLAVHPESPARALYARLGFVEA